MITNEQLSLAKQEYFEEANENEGKVFAYIQALTPKQIDVSQSLENTRISLNIRFLKEDGTIDFGSDMTVVYRAKYDFNTHTYGDKELAIGCGTSGTVTRKEAPYQIDRIRLMMALWDNEEEISKLFDSLSFDKENYYTQLSNQYDKEQWQIEHEKEEKEKQEVLDKFVVGYTFDETFDDYKLTYVVEKITSKRIYFKLTEVRYGYLYESESTYRKWTKTTNSTCYVDKDECIYLKWKGLHICYKLSGNHQIDYKVEYGELETNE